MTVSDGWISLNNEVDWGYQMGAAEVVVRRLLGVRGVTNEVTVKPRAVPTDVKARSRRRSAAEPPSTLARHPGRVPELLQPI